MKRTIAVTLYDKLFLFRDTVEKLKFERDLLKMITNKNYNVDFAKLSDRKLSIEIAKQTFFNEKVLGSKNTRN